MLTNMKNKQEEKKQVVNPKNTVVQSVVKWKEVNEKNCINEECLHSAYCPMEKLPDLNKDHQEQEEWEKEFRAKYEGANIWSSKSIDDVILTIKDLLKEHDMKIRERIQEMKLDPDAAKRWIVNSQPYLEEKVYDMALDDVLAILEGAATSMRTLSF